MTTATAPPAPPASPPAPTDWSEPRDAPRTRPVASVLVVLIAVVLVGAGLIPPGAVFLSLPFIYLIARRPVLRRLALRNASRRPRESVLIVLGALLGTAIITSSYVVGDTLTASINRSAFTQLGPVDEVVLANGPRAGAAVQAAIADAHLNGVDGILSVLAVQAAVATGPGLPARAEPRAQVLETDFTQARDFGGDPSATGISGATPSGNQAVIGADLAATLEIKVGQPVTVYAYGTFRTFTVVRTLPRLGIAGLSSFSTFTGSASPNLFVPPGTLDALQKSGPATSRPVPPLSILAVSNMGNVTSGVQRTAAVHSQLVAALPGLPAQVRDVKKSLLDAAHQAGKGFTQLFQTFGYFSVAVGVLLLINIFVMLAQERKQTLGMLRAIGLRRASLVGSFSIEGWIYSIVSALAGMVVGIGIGRLVITATSRIFNQAGGRRANLSLQFSVTKVSLQAGFMFGFVIALLTVVLTSLYVARLNVIRAIRDLPEPPHDGRRRSVLIAGSLLLVAGGAMTVAGVTGNSAISALAGPAMLGAGLALLLLGRAPQRPSVSIISAAVIAWSIAAPGVLSRAFEKSSLAVFFVQGLVLNVYAVLLVTFNQQTIGAAVRAVGGGARNMSLRLGLAYPLAKRFRTGLLLAMYAIVVFVLVLLTTISHFFGGQISDQIRKIGGGAAIVVDSNPADPVPVADVENLTGVTAVAPTAAVNAEFRLGENGMFNEYTSVGFDPAFVGHGSPDLKAWAKDVGSQADAYRAALSDPTKILVGRDFGNRNFGPGTTMATVGAMVTMRDPVTGQTTALTIIGLVDQSRYDGTDHVYIAQALSDKVFGSRSRTDLLFLSTAAGTDNDRLAVGINGRYVANGADATSFRRIVNDQFSVTNQFLTLLRGYVALGLLVGIAGLGVVMIRAVRERRREVGVLRALGFSGVAVRRAFLAESSFIALEGIAIGTILALITSWQLVDSGNFGSGTRFTVPWVQLAILMVVTFVASLLATATPAVQASRIRPAVALRIAD